MWQPPEDGAGVCERCLGLGTVIQTATDQRPRLGGLRGLVQLHRKMHLVSSNHGRRVVPRTEHEFPTSGTTASSQAFGEGSACFQSSGEWER